MLVIPANSCSLKSINKINRGPLKYVVGRKEINPANMQIHANEAECNFASVCGAADGLQHVCEDASWFQTNFPPPSVAAAVALI